MKRRLAQAWRRLRDRLPATYTGVATVALANVVRNGIRGIVMLIFAGYLGVQALGVVRAIYSVFKITERLTDLGLDYTIVTFCAAAKKREDEAAEREILMSALVLRGVASLVVALGGTAAAPWIAGGLLGDPSLTVYLRMAFYAVAGQLLWSFFSSQLAAGRSFGRLALFLLGVPIFMLGATLVLLATGRFSVGPAVAIFVFSPTVVALIWIAFADLGFLRRRYWSAAAARRVLAFSRWVYASNIVSANRGHLNPVLLKNPALSGSVAAGETNVGLYAFGNDMANEITVISQSIATVLLPTAARRETPAALRRFVGRAYRHLALVLVPAACLPLAARPLLELLGAFRASYLEYLPSLPIFAILYYGALFSLLSVPMSTAIYSMNAPQAEALIEACLLVVLIVASILLIPHFGAKGAAVAVLIQRILATSGLLLYGFRKLRDPVAEPG